MSPPRGRGGPNLDNVAYMQEVLDDSESVVDDNKTYAASQAPTSPGKERMNTSRRKSTRGNSTSPVNVHTDSDTTVHPRHDSIKSRPRDKDDRKMSSSSSSKKVTYAARPTTKHSRTSPLIQTSSTRRQSRDESSYYGVDPITTARSV